MPASRVCDSIDIINVIIRVGCIILLEYSLNIKNKLNYYYGFFKLQYVYSIKIYEKYFQGDNANST